MSNLATSVEHMDRLYLWQTRKLSRRVHIENPATARAFCQAENCRGGKTFDGRGTAIPAGQRLCRNCTDLTSRDEADYREPDIRVLLGERLAETEPEPFTSTAASEPWKRKKQARRINRPKGRKSKCGNVKYAKPFDDDLPW